MKTIKIKPKYKVNDQVRVSIDKKKNHFFRSYNLQNSYAKYKIYKVVTTNTIFPKYYLKHVNKDIKITGGYFFRWQLTPCTVETFRGNVIKSRKLKGKTEHYMHYKGYPDDFNDWQPDNNVTSNLG